MEVKKAFVIAVIALLIGLAAYSLAETAQTLATNTNNTVSNISGFQIDYNNIDHNGLDRDWDKTYTNFNSSPMVLAFSVGYSSIGNGGYNFFLCGVEYHTRFTGALNFTEDDTNVYVLVPSGCTYRIINATQPANSAFFNYWYEWNTTGGGGGGAVNQTFNYYTNTTANTTTLNLTKLDIPPAPCLSIEYLSNPNGTNTTCNKVPITGATTYFLHNSSSDIANTRVANVTVAPSIPVSYINLTAVPVGNTNIGNWTTTALNIGLIPAGTHGLHIHAYKVGGGAAKVVRIFFESYLVNSTGGNMTKIGTSEYSTELPTDITHSETIGLVAQDINTNTTDRIFFNATVQVSGTGAAPDLVFYFDDLTDVRYSIPAITLDPSLFATQSDLVVLNQSLKDYTNASNNSMNALKLNKTDNISASQLPANISYNNTNPTRVYAYLLGAQNLPNGGVQTLINLNATIYDTRGEFNKTTHIFTAQVTGDYDVVAKILYFDKSATSATYGALIFKNAGLYDRIYFPDASTFIVEPTVSTVVHLNASETLSLRGEHYDAGTNVKADSGTYGTTLIISRKTSGD